jgi:hypothetical protein
MTLRTQLAYIAAGVIGLIGLLGFLLPNAAAGLYGLAIGAGRGVSEIRSVYGALFLTVAGLALWAISSRPKSAPLLRTLGLLFLGAAAGRLASLLIDGAADLVNVLLLLVQLAVGGTLLWASLESEKARIEARVAREAERKRQAQRPPAAAGRPAAGTSAFGRPPARSASGRPATGTPSGAPAEGGVTGDGAPEGGIPPRPSEEASERP